MTFATALIDAKAPVPDGLTLPSRFRIYRNNVAAALINALAVRFPRTKELVGQEFFNAMARTYALCSLPRSPILIDYGAEFPAFIADFPPAASVPYLADLARLEDAWWMAYHADEMKSLDAEDFAAVPSGSLGSLRLEFHPSFAIVSSQHPVGSIWNGDLTTDGATGGERVLLARPDAEVLVRIMPNDAALFLSTLANGETLASTVEAVTALHPAFDITAQLMSLISLRLAVNASFEGES